MRGLRHNRVICLASLVLLLQVALAASKHDHHDTSSKHDKKEISRKSIVFDSKTPNVFYCPQEKPTDVGKMIVKAKPLDKLCEFGGKSKPKGEPTDCYNDVDETQFACDEKRRFLLRRDLPIDDANAAPDETEYLVSKGHTKKRAGDATGHKL